MKTCSAKDCLSAVVVKNMCRKHYSQAYTKANKDQLTKYWAQYRKNNREKLRSYHRSYKKTWREQNPDSLSKDRVYWYLKKYGLSTDDLDKMLKSCNNSCEICGMKFTPPEDGKQGGSRYSFRVDHCHRTGKVRGLLCNACNRMLGYAKDDPAVLAGGKAYLLSKQRVVRVSSSTLRRIKSG